MDKLLTLAYDRETQPEVYTLVFQSNSDTESAQQFVTVRLLFPAVTELTILSASKERES